MRKTAVGSMGVFFLSAVVWLCLEPSPEPVVVTISALGGLIVALHRYLQEDRTAIFTAGLTKEEEGEKAALFLMDNVQQVVRVRFFVSESTLRSLYEAESGREQTHLGLYYREEDHIPDGAELGVSFSSREQDLILVRKPTPRVEGPLKVQGILGPHMGITTVLVEPARIEDS